MSCDQPLLALRKEGARSQGMWPASKSEKPQGDRFFPEQLERKAALLTPQLKPTETRVGHTELRDRVCVLSGH